MDGTATYLYCIVHASASPATARAPRGLPGATRPAVAAVARALWVIVASVPLEVVRTGRARIIAPQCAMGHRCGDCPRGGRRVLHPHSGRHRDPDEALHDVLVETRAVEDMRSRRRDLESVVRRIAGCEEWGVRITHRPPAVPRSPGRHTKIASGTEFLAARKAARDGARESAAAGLKAAEQAYLDARGSCTRRSAPARRARRRDNTSASRCGVSGSHIAARTLQGCRQEAGRGRTRWNGGHADRSVALVQLHPV